MVREDGRKYAAQLLDENKLLSLSNAIRLNILRALCRKPMYAKELARELKLKPTIVYYHIDKLTRDGLIRCVGELDVRGARARKFSVNSSAYAYVLEEGDGQRGPKSLVRNTILEKFYDEVGANFTLVVGSLEPHGLYKARSYDHRYAIELAFYLGKFAISGGIDVKLDTEVKDDELKRNVILVGGPVVNMISFKVNEYLPIRFVPQEDNAIHSTITGRSYREESNGVVEVVDNPFDPKSKILILAGKRLKGTKSAILALITRAHDISRGNVADSNILAHVVEGFDEDSDGEVDSVEIME